MGFGKWPLIIGIKEPGLSFFIRYLLIMEISFDIFIDNYNVLVRTFNDMFNFFYFYYFLRIVFIFIGLFSIKIILFINNIILLEFELLDNKIRLLVKYKDRFIRWI